MNSIPNFGKHGFVPVKSGMQTWQVVAVIVIITAVLGILYSCLFKPDKEKEEAEQLNLAELRDKVLKEILENRKPSCK